MDSLFFFRSANATKEPKGIYDLWLTNYTVENQVENYYIVKKKREAIWKCLIAGEWLPDPDHKFIKYYVAI